MLNLKGSFRVNKVKLFSSNIQYAALFLDDRIVFVKTGGQFADFGAGTIASAAAGGIGGMIVGMMLETKVRRSSRELKDAETAYRAYQMSVEDLLKADKKNFEILYGTILWVQMKEATIGINGTRTGTLCIQCGTKESLDIAPGQDFTICRDIVTSTLPGKLK